MRKRTVCFLGMLAITAGIAVLAIKVWSRGAGQRPAGPAQPGRSLQVVPQPVGPCETGDPSAASHPCEGEEEPVEPWSWELPDPPRDEPERMINWINYQVKHKKPGAFEKFLALLEDLPQEWDGNQRDRLRAAILYKLGALGDVRAIPVVELYLQREPEGEGFEVKDPDNGEKIRAQYRFSVAAEEALAHLRFLEAFGNAKTDDERAELCLQDLLRIWTPGGAVVGIQPGGMELLLEGRERYLAYLRDATRRVSEDDAYSIIHLLELMLERGHSPQLEAVFAEVAQERRDSVADHAVVVLERYGTPDSLPALEEIARRREPERGDRVRQAIGAIQWRKALQDTQGRPSVEQLRWALDCPAISKDASELIQKLGDWPLEEIRRGVAEMETGGRRACMDILRSVLGQPERRAEALLLAHELSNSQLHTSVQGRAISFVAEFGSAEDHEVLAERARRIRARVGSGTVGSGERKELAALEDALERFKPRK